MTDIINNLYLDRDVLQHLSSIQNLSGGNFFGTLSELDIASDHILITGNVYDELVALAVSRPEHVQVLEWVDEGIHLGFIEERPNYPQFTGQNSGENSILLGHVDKLLTHSRAAAI